eukprot:3473349-Pyramimonas_sp.AAC.1
MKTEHCLTLTEPVRRMHVSCSNRYGGVLRGPLPPGAVPDDAHVPGSERPALPVGVPGDIQCAAAHGGAVRRVVPGEPAYPGTRARVPGDPSPRTRGPEPAYPATRARVPGTWF